MNRRKFLQAVFASAALACCPVPRRRCVRSRSIGGWRWFAEVRVGADVDEQPINAGHTNTVTCFKRPSQVNVCYQREIEFVNGLHPDFLRDYRSAVAQFRKFKDAKGQPLLWSHVHVTAP